MKIKKTVVFAQLNENCVPGKKKTHLRKTVNVNQSDNNVEEQDEKLSVL